MIQDTTYWRLRTTYAFYSGLNFLTSYDSITFAVETQYINDSIG